MKRTVSVLLVAVSTLSLSACADDYTVTGKRSYVDPGGEHHWVLECTTSTSKLKQREVTRERWERADLGEPCL